VTPGHPFWFAQSQNAAVTALGIGAPKPTTSSTPKVLRYRKIVVRAQARRTARCLPVSGVLKKRPFFWRAYDGNVLSCSSDVSLLPTIGGIKCFMECQAAMSWLKKPLVRSSLRSKINAEVKDPVVLVLWVSVADRKLVARSHAPR
jgi:hypothetical protein